MSDGRLAGIGIDEYTTKAHRPLAHAVSDVEALSELLNETFEGQILKNPTETDLRTFLKSLKRSLDGGPLVVVWSGHGVPSAAGLRLPATDSGADADDGLGVADVVGPCALSGANQLLFVFDTCFAGEAIPAGDLATQIMRATQDARQVWVGVVTSCLTLETARDGLFGERLRKVLRSGPDLPELRVRWSVHNKYVRGDDVCDAVLKEWDSAAQSPDFQSRGNAWWMFANPLYRPGAPEQVVEHLLRAARSGAPLNEQTWFTGRTAEVNQVVAWVRDRQPGLYVVTGSAGTGKSAIVGRVVSLSNPDERGRLLADGHTWSHELPEERSVSAHVHARGLTADLAADVLAGQLVQCGLLTPQEARRNASELVGEVQRAVEEGARRPVLVVDGLDEARGEAFTIADDLLTRLSRYATVIVSTREMQRGEGQLPLVAALTPEGPGIDLDEEAVRRQGQEDLAEYVRLRLRGVDARMDADAIAAHLFGADADDTTQHTFLLARLVSDQLVAAPVDTSAERWTEEVSHSVEEALDIDLATVSVPGHRAADGEGSPVALARSLLRALTWGYGAGFPEAEWLAVANAEAPEGVEVTREDIGWVLDQLGRHIIQDGEANVAVYRMAHQSLADHLRPPYRGSAEEPFNPEASKVAEAMAGRYRTLLEAGIPADEPHYLWLYAWRHAAEAGPAGVELLSSLVEESVELLPDLGLADSLVSDRFGYWGRWQDALPVALHAVQLYQALAEQNAFYLSDLADALDSLGVCFGSLGRHLEALPPAEEATTLYRNLAEQNPAHLSSLASSLNNLGIGYSDLGQHAKALPPTEEATTLYRNLAEQNPAHLPSLASSLNNLGNRYSSLGRHAEALPLAKEAVRLRRMLADENPVHLSSLASSLNNLGIRHSELGQYREALPVTEEATVLYRSLAKENPSQLPDLASCLNNLGVRYSELGRHAKALPPTEEAVHLRRMLAEENPAYIPDLASALSNLGARSSNLGRYAEALPPTQEAIALLRTVSQENPAYLPKLAGSLNNLGVCYSNLGRYAEALPPTEEAVHLRRALAEENPAYIPDLASALNNLGIRYGELGQHVKALAPTEEAVLLRRALANENRVHLSSLASSLSNLGIHYSDLGRYVEALPPAEEATALYRSLTEQSPAHLADLAGVLSNLSVRYSDLGRYVEALPPAEEATALYRSLAEENPSHLPDLASSLNNLSISYSDLGQHAQALPPTEEAVHLRRKLADENPTHFPSLAYLANSLDNLGHCYSDLGQHAQALPPTEEAVHLHRKLADENPTHLPHLASSLNKLSALYATLGRSADDIWADILDGAPASHTAMLLLARATTAPAGDPQAIEWLVTCDRLSASLPQPRRATLHTEVRRHRAVAPAAFDDAWSRLTGAKPPRWSTLDSELLHRVMAWIETETYEAERDHLAAHPEILAPETDAAVDEVLLGINEEEAQRYRALRLNARAHGAEAAYRPLLHGILLREFARAAPATQRDLLAERRNDLLGETVQETLSELLDASDPDAPPTEYDQAAALLHLASLEAHEPALDALADWSRFPALLGALARDFDPSALAATAYLARLTADNAAQAATAEFYLAVSAVIEDNAEAASELIASAHAYTPDAAPTWINDLAEIARHHQAVLPLIPTLTTLMTTPKDAEDESDATD
ncbi:tetratricopeptide repeat protein [Streptomyces sp. NPDC052610]|uniref:tetratricopeptide repeat protein n=1 Tax=Streptomyces sp. NPDC052610 TaxID=3154952 RepID=UPI003415E5DA